MTILRCCQHATANASSSTVTFNSRWQQEFAIFQQKLKISDKIPTFRQLVLKFPILHLTFLTMGFSAPNFAFWMKIFRQKDFQTLLKTVTNLRWPIATTPATAKIHPVHLTNGAQTPGDTELCTSQPA